MKKIHYVAPIAEQMEIAVESRFLNESNLAQGSSVETADYHGNEEW